MDLTTHRPVLESEMTPRSKVLQKEFHDMPITCHIDAKSMAHSYGYLGTP
jgi:hypothetical protein